MKTYSFIRLTRWCVLACGISIAMSITASAETYPSKPVRLLIPYPPGGITDVLGRIYAQRLSETFAQPVVVENRAGASGAIAFGLVARSQPDGYTLVFSPPSPLTIVPFVMRTSLVNPKDFIAVSQIAGGPLVLLSTPRLKKDTLEEIIALAKSKPGSLSIASAGNGTLLHLAAALFMSETNTSLLHVPYKGSGPALTDLVGGQTDLMFDNISSALPHIKSGRLHGIAMTSQMRSPVLPGTPTMEEAGLPNYVVSNWVGLFVPSATPRELVKRLHQETVKAMLSEEARASFQDLGMSVIAGSPEQVAKVIASETEQWQRVVTRFGIRVD